MEDHEPNLAGAAEAIVKEDLAGRIPPFGAAAAILYANRGRAPSYRTPDRGS
jgi:hypothetical protein